MDERNKGRQLRRTREYMLAIAAKSRPGARIRLAVRRCFILSDGRPILVRDVLSRAFPKLRRFNSWHYWSARRALRQVAVIIARKRHGRGRACLWALRDMDAT
jgi:hypothetical protein